MNNYSPQRFSTLPLVIKNLLIINGLFFLASFTMSHVFRVDLTDILGLHYPSAEKFRPYQFFTYMFMHGGFSHIFFNMFALWMFGNILENVWGPKRFLVFYFFTGIGAALTHYTIFYFQINPLLNSIDLLLASPSIEGLRAFIESPDFAIVSQDVHNNLNTFIREYNYLITTDSAEALQLGINFIKQYRIDLLNAPVVIGASGAVFGVLLAFGLMFPNSLIYIYFAIPIKAKYFVLIYGALELWSGISNNAGDNVSHFAHLGGMVFGFILLYYWDRNKKNLF